MHLYPSPKWPARRRARAAGPAQDVKGTFEEGPNAGGGTQGPDARQATRTGTDRGGFCTNTGWPLHDIVIINIVRHACNRGWSGVNTALRNRVGDEGGE